MTTKNFLDLDIDKLFAEHTIKEIEEIQKKIQYESERKKIELRTLVGERYRDLIQAADTISQMQKTSESVVSRISTIEKTFRELQQKYLIGFKMDFEKSPIRDIREVSDYVIIRIKILMDIPEYIWSAIDNRNLLFATQLFIFARHINYGLSFELGNEELSKKYPVVGKQWEVVSQFKNVIFQSCHSTLRSLELSIESAANSLSSLVLLNDTSSIDLLKNLIASRSSAIECTIKEENPNGVKKRIKLCIKLLIETITLVYSAFIKFENKEGLVIRYVKSISDLEAASLLDRLDLDEELINEFLPAITKMHKPFTEKHFDNPSPTDLKENIESWLEWIRTFTSTEITKLLSFITTIKGLHNIREEVASIDLPENWATIWEVFELPAVNFWSEYFQPLVTKRAKDITNEKWKTTLANLKTNVTQMLKKITNEKYDCPEHDLRWFIWKDSPTDIPQKLSIAKNDGVGGINERSLLMKAKGFSPNIVNLCQEFDRNLVSLLVDLEKYLYETERVNFIKTDLLTINISVISNMFSDRQEVQENLQDISRKMILELLDFIKSDCLTVDLKDDTKSRNEKCAIFLARFLQALTTLCPNLNKCLTLTRLLSGINIINTKWQSICDILRDESLSIWSIWAKSYCSNIPVYLEKYLNSDFQYGFKIHSIISEWEKDVIEEEAEEGKRIQSEILVPYQPSVNLQKFLANINTDLNKIIPHTLPKKVLNEIIENIVTEICKYFLQVSKKQELRQKQAFQVLFDVKYVTLLMVPRENKSLTEKSIEVCDNIILKIDPFDLDVFYPFIHTNVKKAAQRSLLIHGNLVPHLEQLHSILGSRVDYGTSESGTSAPAVLALCTGAPWFPPLAVTVPTRNLPLVPVPIPDKTQRKKAVPVKEHTRNDSTGATIKSGAAAFFGAMGTDWFGAS